MKVAIVALASLFATSGCRSTSSKGPCAGPERNHQACCHSQAQRRQVGTADGAGRAELIDMNGSLQALRDRFNAHQDRMQVIALFSPI